MIVYVKDMSVNMEVKTKGIEFEVRDNKNKFRGDCIVNKTGLIWCPGRTAPANGKKVSWDKFIQWMSEE